MSRAKPNAKIFDAAAAAASGAVVFVEDDRFVVVSLNTVASANFTIKWQGSILDELPDFSAARSVANPWDYIDATDLQNGNSIDGDTGVAASGTDDHRLFQINVDGLRWFSATITAQSAGNVTVLVKVFKT